MANNKNWLTGFVSVYKGKIIEILQKTLPGGKTHEVARRAPGVRIIAITKDTKFILSREHREYLENEVDTRLPGGKVVDTLAEYHQLIDNGNLETAILEAAKKELLEETGITAQKWVLIKVSTSGGTIGWDLHYFVATELSFGEQRPEDDEKIQVVKLSLTNTIETVLLNLMSEDRSRMALLEYLLLNHPIEVANHIVEMNTNDS